MVSPTGSYLGFECKFCFLYMLYFWRQVTIWVWSAQPTLVSKLPLQLGPRRSQSAFFFKIFICNTLLQLFTTSRIITAAMTVVSTLRRVSFHQTFFWVLLYQKYSDSVFPPWNQGGMIFVLSARQGWQLLNFRSQGGNIFRGGGGDFRHSSRGGGLLYHDELLVFLQNASPWILQILPVALSYIFLTFS